MTDRRHELAAIARYVVNSIGRTTITLEDWVHIISVQRRWCPPGRARRLADEARGMGLLQAGASSMEVAVEELPPTLPLDYRPRPEVFVEDAPAVHIEDKAPQPLFRRIVHRVGRAIGETDAKVVARVNALQSSMAGAPSADVAALQLAALQGVDIADLVAEAVEAHHVPPGPQK